MGIQGLLPFLKKATKPVNIRSFSGSTVAVDAYCWLHKGAFSCAERLVKGEETDGYVHYCMKMVNLLLDAGLKPILVFDGKTLPSKSATEKKRRENRKNYRLKGKELLRSGQLKEAKECFQRCVDITPEMALAVIKACRRKNIDYIVAPYEADAQLAYLNKCGIAQIVITEDSDLLLFGCEKVIFKMDNGGSGIMIEKSSLYQCMGVSAEKFTFEKFRYMCILSGCDYLPSLPGIGLAKSCKFFRLCSNPNIDMMLPKLPTYLKMPNLVVTAEYKDGFIKANNTFLYQLVFCPLQRKLIPLNTYSPDLNPLELQYAGPYFSDELAYQLAIGNININTMKLVDDFDPEKKNRITKSVTWDGRVKSSKSIWDENYKAVSSVPPSFSFKSTSTKGKTLTINTDNVLKPLNKQPIVSDEKLFTMYSEVKSDDDYAATMPCKKSRLDSFNEEIDQPKCPKPKAINIFKIKDPMPNTVVRSRFFFTPVKESHTDSKVAPWLDEIQKHYKASLCSTPKSECLELQGTSRHSDKQVEQIDSSTEILSKSDNWTSPKKPSTGNKDFGFKWSTPMKYTDKIIPNNSVTEAAFKKVIASSSPFAAQKENEKPFDMSESKLSQESNRSIDADSAYLSQESEMHLSSCSSHNSSQNKDTVLQLSNSDNAQTCITGVTEENLHSVKVISPKLLTFSRKQVGNEKKIAGKCRRAGLPKNRNKCIKVQKTDLRQLDLKESFEKFKFIKQTVCEKLSSYFEVAT